MLGKLESLMVLSQTYAVLFVRTYTITDVTSIQYTILFFTDAAYISWGRNLLCES